MEPDDTGLSPYFHHHQFPFSTATATTAAAANGISQTAPQMVYSSSSVPPVLKRKRGRPRKYGTPEQAAAAKRLSSSSNSSAGSAPKKERSSSAGGDGGAVLSKKNHLGNGGRDFTTHVINVVAGEDVGQKIMSAVQQSKRDICILSAYGSVSNVSLRQPAVSGGTVTYEGQFQIVSLQGSFVRTESGGRTGGLSVCLSSDGQIIGGSIAGPLIAADSIRVVVASFLFDSTKNLSVGVNVGEASPSNTQSSPTIVEPISSVGFFSVGDYSVKVATSGNEEQNNGGIQFMLQPRSMQTTPSHSTDWMGSTDSRTSAGFDFSGRMGLGGHQSPDNRDYEQYED